MKRTAFWVALLSVVCVGCVEERTPPAQVAPATVKAPTEPIVFDQGPEWERYWELKREHAYGRYIAVNFMGRTEAVARDCADVLLLESIGFGDAGDSESFQCTISWVQTPTVEVADLLKAANVHLGWFLWGMMPYDPESMGRCSEPRCGEYWRTMWVSDGPVGRSSSGRTISVELRENGWSMELEGFSTQSLQLDRIGDLNENGSFELLIWSGEDAIRGTYRNNQLRVAELGRGFWSRGQVSRWRENVRRRASAELWESPTVRTYALKSFIRGNARFVERMMGWDDDEGVF